MVKEFNADLAEKVRAEMYREASEQWSLNNYAVRLREKPAEAGCVFVAIGRGLKPYVQSRSGRNPACAGNAGWIAHYITL